MVVDVDLEGHELTRSFCVIPVSILSSHSGMLPFSVTKSISKPAFLNSVYGIAVSLTECE